MKNHLILAVFLTVFFNLNSQCNLTGSYSPNPLPCNQTATLSVVANGSSLVFGEDFNSGSPVGWQWTQTVTIANNTCGVPSLDGSNFMWMGSASQHPRTMTTNAVDLSCGGDICFEMRYAIQGHSAPCEGPDLTSEGVYLQYSLNNSTWTTIDYWPPLNGGSSSSPMTQWAQYCRALPIGAQTTATYIRWHQAASSSSIYDHWGLDNIGVNATTCGGYQVTWLHDNYSLPVGTYTGTNPTGVSPISNTSYVVQMSNGTNTCYDTVNIVVQQPVLTTNDVTICDGESVTLNSSASLTGGNYLWSTGSSTSSTTVNPNSTTSYTVDYTLGPCPTVSSTVNVTVNPAPTLTVSDTNICEGETVVISAIPSQTGGTYLWSNGATTQSISISPLSTTNYSVTYNLGGCTPATENINVTVNAAPTISVGNDSICSGESIVITSNPSQLGGVFSWSSGESTQSITVNPTVTTNYTVTYTLGSCTPAIATSILTVSPAPSVVVNNDSICEGESTILTCNPSISGGNYSWDNGATTQSINVSPVSTTNYTVTYTIGGCTPATTSATISVNPAPTITVSNDSICEGESALLLCSPSQSGGVFSWSNGGDVDSIIVSPISTTVYSVSYSLGSCIVALDSGTVLVTPAPILSINNDSICIGESASISAVPSQTGGAYLWSNGATTQSINVTPTASSYFPITYSLGGCTPAIDSVYVMVNPLPIVNVSDIIICEGATGTLTAIPDQTGGAFIWSNGSSSQSINDNPLIPTSYTVTYTLGGCSPVDATALIDIMPAPSVSVADVTICDGEVALLDAILSLNAASQSGGMFLWSDGSITEDLNVSPSVTTVYDVTYSVGGCLPATASATVTVNPLPSVTFSSNITEGCAPLDFVLTADLNSSLANSYTWSLSDGQIFNGNPVSVTFSNPGTYDVSLEIISNQGCINNLTLSSYIYVEEDPIADFTVSSSTFTDLSQQISFFNSTTGADTYLWNFGDGSTSILIDPFYWYNNTVSGYQVSLIASSALNCTDTAFLEIPYVEGLTYYVPNTFTPDGDLFNQTFKPVFTSGFDPNQFSMKIFNRWGEIIFESKNSQIGWDGSYGINGSKVPEGVYTYHITYKIPNKDERRIVTGHVNLLK